MQAQVKAWGNSQGIRLSKELLEKAGIRLNDLLTIEAKEGTIILKKEFKHKTLEERAAEFKKRIQTQNPGRKSRRIWRKTWSL